MGHKLKRQLGRRVAAETSSCDETFAEMHEFPLEFAE